MIELAVGIAAAVLMGLVVKRIGLGYPGDDRLRLWDTKAKVRR